MTAFRFFPSLRDLINVIRPGAKYVSVNGVITVWDGPGALPSAEELRAAETQWQRNYLHNARRTTRTRAETGGFVFNGHPVDSDRDSILRIGNAATTALTALLTSTQFSTTWACADEYQMYLDAAGVMALQAALSAHGLACHLRSQELKALIDAPDADLDALADVISTGWPGPAQP
jgi:hypothetical protein